MNYICAICGMEINNKNKNMNKNAFINGNMDENTIACPFCGASHKYITSEDKLIKYIINDELNSDTKKILDHGVKLELFNSDFYKKAASLAEKDEISAMFLDLSKIEKMHAMIHYKLGGFNVFPKLADIKYDRYKNDNLLIEQAVLREKHAVEFYNKYLSIIDNEVVREILLVLRDIEKEHLELLI
jgi:rubrerythrin